MVCTMNLFHEYQTLTCLPTLSPQDLERMAEIVDIASSDDVLFSAIMNLEYLLAQEDGLLAEPLLQQYVEQQTQLSQRMEADFVTRSVNFPQSNVGGEFIIVPK